MPPKVVYGKKRPNAKTQTSFTKFLSPEKRAVVPQEPLQITSEEEQDNRQRRPRSRVEEAKADERLEADDVTSLERGFKNWEVEKREGVTVERPTTSKKHGVQQAKRGGRKQVQQKEGTALVEDDLAQGLQSLSMTDNAPAEATKDNKALQYRKALGDRNANATKAEATQNHCGGKVVPNRRTVVEVRIPAREKKTSAKSTSSPSSLLCGSDFPTTQTASKTQDIFSDYASPLLALSDRKHVLPFEEWLAELEPYFEISKIAEASFSEVYRLTARLSADGQNQESVLKVVALKTPPAMPLPCQQQARAVRDRDAQIIKERAELEEKDQWKSHVADVLSEVKLLQNINHIPGFTVFRDLTIVQGRPSAAFNNAWKSWNKSRPRGKKSEFPDPSKKTNYDDHQLWAIVEMQDAGTDCEKIMEMGGLTSIWEVWDVFWGVCLSVAKAEEACKFEHRDLHLGNICVRSAESPGDVLQTNVHDPIRRKLHFTALETTVIDYTLSRADMVIPGTRRSSSTSCISNSTSGSRSILGDTDVAYLDLNKDPALFEGDASEEYQYEIYRYMRGAALFSNPLQSAPSPPSTNLPSTPRRSPRKNTHIRFGDSDDEDQKPSSPRRSPRKHTASPSEQLSNGENGDEDVWKAFHPKTNLVWAHFLLHKLLQHMDYHHTTPAKLSEKNIMQNILDEEDAAKVKKKAGRLHKILSRVRELLCPIALGKEDGLSSMKELVVLALEERWLRVSDVEG